MYSCDTRAQGKKQVFVQEPLANAFILFPSFFIVCAVLVMTGDRDLIVPAWNAKRVAAAIPGSTFQVISKCGHVPQEEKAGEVLRGITGVSPQDAGPVISGHGLFTNCINTLFTCSLVRYFGLSIEKRHPKLTELLPM